MPRVSFTPNLRKHLECPPREVPGETIREVLEAVFAEHPRLKNYVVDDQGELRKHVLVFVGSDPGNLATTIEPDGEVYVMQALSGG